jgi:anti-sigma-K factor RskA
MNDTHGDAALYAVGALPDDEARAFQAHLSTCPECRQEVAEMQELAAQLSQSVATPPPAGLREAVLTQVARTPQESSPHDEQYGASAQRADERSNVVPLPVRRRWLLSGLVAAAAVVAAVSFGGWAIHSNRVAQQATAQSHQLASLLAAPDVRTVTSRVHNGGTATLVLSRGRGQALLVSSGLPSLPAGKVYELWTIHGKPVPAGTFTPQQTQSLVQLPGAATRASAVAMTVEPAGGSKQPTSKPVFQVSVPRSS